MNPAAFTVLANKWEMAVVRKPSGCWDWSGDLHSCGYGMVRAIICGVMHREYAHRLSEMIHHGPIREGLHVMHLCHNPICSNPEHIRAGTRPENLYTSHIAGRLERKIPVADLAAVMARRKAGDSYRTIGRTYGCSAPAVRFMVMKHGHEAVYA